jgi:hypothetical protein
VRYERARRGHFRSFCRLVTLMVPHAVGLRHAPLRPCPCVPVCVLTRPKCLPDPSARCRPAPPHGRREPNPALLPRAARARHRIHQEAAEAAGQERGDGGGGRGRDRGAGAAREEPGGGRAGRQELTSLVCSLEMRKQAATPTLPAAQLARPRLCTVAIDADGAPRRARAARCLLRPHQPRRCAASVGRPSELCRTRMRGRACRGPRSPRPSPVTRCPVIGPPPPRRDAPGDEERRLCHRGGD